MGQAAVTRVAVLDRVAEAVAATDEMRAQHNTIAAAVDQAGARILALEARDRDLALGFDRVTAQLRAQCDVLHERQGKDHSEIVILVDRVGTHSAHIAELAARGTGYTSVADRFRWLLTGRF